MVEFLSIMGPALTACLLLSGIFVYFGLHIVRRGVIFVDLALAQVAAMGSTVAFLLGYALDGQGAYFLSLLFAFFGSIVFAMVRTREEVVPQEALIGIVYAFAAAATILLVDKAPHGAEHIKYLLVGNILWVSWKTIAQLLVVIVIVALFHYVFRNDLSRVSFDPQRAQREKMSVHFWDMLFYLSLAWVVTSSVQTAGVLLVFSFLIVPAVCGLLLSTEINRSLLVGWCVSAAVSFAGAGISYSWDLPTGAAIICTFGATLLLIALFKKILAG
jgi:zinc/manganese transport system permease protein